jgi:acetyl esterase
VSVRDDELKSSTGPATIPIRIYKSTAQDSTSPVPAAVYYHGGGWILGNIQADDLFCRKIAKDLGHVVISVEYRLAPEHVFPSAVDDCFDAFECVSCSSPLRHKDSCL